MKLYEGGIQMKRVHSEIQEYLIQCEIYGWTPSWEGARAYFELKGFRRRWASGMAVQSAG